MPRKLIIVTLASTLMLTGCTTNNNSPLHDHLVSSTSTTTEQVRFSDLYDEKWTEFALICPYTPNEWVEEELGIKSNMSLFDRSDEGTVKVILKNDDKAKWVRLSRVGLHDLCTGDGTTLKFHPADSILEFEYNHKYDKWELNTITEPQSQ